MLHASPYVLFMKTWVLKYINYYINKTHRKLDTVHTSARVTRCSVQCLPTYLCICCLLAGCSTGDKAAARTDRCFTYTCARVFLFNILFPEENIICCIFLMCHCIFFQQRRCNATLVVQAPEGGGRSRSSGWRGRGRAHRVVQGVANPHLTQAPAGAARGIWPINRCTTFFYVYSPAGRLSGSTFVLFLARLRPLKHQTQSLQKVLDSFVSQNTRLNTSKTH